MVQGGVQRAVSVASAVLVVGAVVVGCAPTASPVPADVPQALAERLEAIETAIDAWQSAPDAASGLRFAEEARNLVVGPDNTLYGDADGDGVIQGASDAGLLTGEGGLAGLVDDIDTACVERDVRGGSWADPAARWAEFADVVAAWSPQGNTMPQLASHPQRIVGWATLTLDSDDVDTMREYAGHARLHSDVTVSALYDCAS